MSLKPRVRVKAGSSTSPVAVRPVLPGGEHNVIPLHRAFDAGKAGRRLRSIPTAQASINSQISAYGRTILARSRYLAANNPYANAAKQTFVSALVGDGIKPSPLLDDAAQKAAFQEAWLEWTDEADADNITDLYGLQAMVAAELFEAGECFVRMRARRPEDGLSVPLQLQILPAEMLDVADNRTITIDGVTTIDGKPVTNRIECGIQFDTIGRRVAYHFYRNHPGSALVGDNIAKGEKTVVPADEVLHLYKPMIAGQIRGVPHTLSAIAKLAMMDQYDDAELERKKTAALFSGFVTRKSRDDLDHPLENGYNGDAIPDMAGTFGLEPGAMVDLEDGEDVKFAEPADVGGNYEVFQYRTLLAIAAGFGVPYSSMTGDLRQANYGSIRAGLVEFRRRIEAIQHHIMVFQFCRLVYNRWLTEAVLSQTIDIKVADFYKNQRKLRKVKWIPPKWDWIDPLKDQQAERLAVRAGFKSRSDVIEASGYDPEETDARIEADQLRADKAKLVFDSDARQTSTAGVTQARPAGTKIPYDVGDDPAANTEEDPSDQPPAPEPEPNARLPMINITVPVTIPKKGKEITNVLSYDDKGRIKSFERHEEDEA